MGKDTTTQSVLFKGLAKKPVVVQFETEVVVQMQTSRFGTCTFKTGNWYAGSWMEAGNSNSTWLIRATRRQASKDSAIGSISFDSTGC